MDGRLSGEAFVVLESQEALQAAMALDKQKLGNRCVPACLRRALRVCVGVRTNGCDIN